MVTRMKTITTDVVRENNQTYRLGWSEQCKDGSKMGVDATRKWSTEGFTRPWPDEILMDEKTKAIVDKKWKELGIE